jgi:hypothetical protein
MYELTQTASYFIFDNWLQGSYKLSKFLWSFCVKNLDIQMTEWTIMLSGKLGVVLCNQPEFVNIIKVMLPANADDAHFHLYDVIWWNSC